MTVLIVATACLMAIANVGCQPAANSKANLDVDLTLDPSPPAVGENQISLHLKDAKGSPIQGATVHVEGNMNHAGMKPSLAELHETGPGKYGGTLRFTMGGDWYFLITAELPDGKVVEKTIEVPGVLSQ